MLMNLLAAELEDLPSDSEDREDMDRAGRGNNSVTERSDRGYRNRQAEEGDASLTQTPTDVLISQLSRARAPAVGKIEEELVSSAHTKYVDGGGARIRSLEKGGDMRFD